jgi:hypothetical protein
VLIAVAAGEQRFGRYIAGQINIGGFISTVAKRSSRQSTFGELETTTPSGLRTSENGW